MAANDVTVTRMAPSGALQLSALVIDKNPAGNPWGSAFFHRVTYMGYTRREAIAAFLDSLQRDGLRIVEEAQV